MFAGAAAAGVRMCLRPRANAGTGYRLDVSRGAFTAGRTLVVVALDGPVLRPGRQALLAGGLGGVPESGIDPQESVELLVGDVLAVTHPADDPLGGTANAPVSPLIGGLGGDLEQAHRLELLDIRLR